MKRLIGLTALAVLGTAGIVMAGREKSQLSVKVDPVFWDTKITRIGLIGYTYPHSDDVRMEDTVPDLVNGAFQDQGEFNLMFPDDIKRAAEVGGFKEAYDTLIRVWRARGELDPPALAVVQAALDVDALAAVDLTHWEQRKLDFSEEGYSTTTVGLRSRLWDARTRTLLWQASLIKVGNSPPYNPSGASAADAGGTSRQAVKTVPEPPKYDQIADEVVTEVIGSYPQPEDKERLMKEAAKRAKTSKKKEDGR